MVRYYILSFLFFCTFSGLCNLILWTFPQEQGCFPALRLPTQLMVGLHLGIARMWAWFETIAQIFFPLSLEIFLYNSRRIIILLFRFLYLFWHMLYFDLVWRVSKIPFICDLFCDISCLHQQFSFPISCFKIVFILSFSI